MIELFQYVSARCVPHKHIHEYLGIDPSDAGLPCIFYLDEALACCKEGPNDVQSCGRHIGQVQENFLK
eukprot:1346767-Ditylum_brightwellii.AAC.1